MKLFLLRHAKTKQFSSSGSDFDRKLKEKGEKQLDLMKAHLKEYFPTLSLKLLVSTAKRTTQTYTRLKNELNNCEVEQESDLYLADLNIHLNKIWNAKTPKDLFIIGHNYGISETAEYFLASPVNLPTCGFLVLEFDVESWQEASRGCATLHHQFYPQVLD